MRKRQNEKAFQLAICRRIDNFLNTFFHSINEDKKSF